MNAGKDVHVLRGSFVIRSPRSVILLNPFQFAPVVAMLVLAVTYTLWPEALEHSPVSFEERGFIHHLWHYSLLAGSILTLVGMFSAGARRMQTEVVGIVLLTGALGVNLTAVIAESMTEAGDELSGFTVGLRVALIIGFLLRAGILVFEPTVDLRGDDTIDGL